MSLDPPSWISPNSSLFFSLADKREQVNREIKTQKQSGRYWLGMWVPGYFHACYIAHGHKELPFAEPKALYIAASNQMLCVVHAFVIWRHR